MKLERNSEQPHERKRSRTTKRATEEGKPLKNKDIPPTLSPPQNEKDGSDQNCNTQR